MSEQARQGAYFDAATASPLHPAAREAMIASLADGWADPSRLYTQARRARGLLDAARGATAEVLGVRPAELTFTAGGTAAAHLAVLGGLAGRRRSGRVFVHSAIEHSAVLHAGEDHVSAGGTAVSVPVDGMGRLDEQAWQAAVGADGVALAALIAASHEVGTLQPVDRAAEVCAAHGVPLLVDAAVIAGRMPLPTGWSMLTASARKWGGPPGVGVLAVRTGTRFDPPLSAHWSQPERAAGHGPGAPDLPAIVAAAAALRAAWSEAAAESARLSKLVDHIRDRVAATIPDVEVVGDPVDRAPHLVTFSCLYVDGESLLRELDRRGYAVSSGSSCTSSTLEPSHVLVAMGALSHGNVRVSLHRDVTEEQVRHFLAELPEIIARLREEAGVTGL
ncbi:cysteine desulfurase [Hamadaea flava]|uniref:Cysteine desulfurase family protein n=1 Tax=Hamadaea flava TaxID=1742688 RepID=A0ABV8LTM0_9ACTN|nr:aminotransferase class V-fold PLP-dependent enzyme [Hamadaea flava]MCP2327844.1 cysteine desulfurase [Hamadaea flava]